ncbi:DUF4870 domain-containing protein [Bacillus sp. 2205SS5-2]|uniref:DUF4870 domain-containing protein n=1 Tax=Bacillus sp. 2205SS5-2 TaxID=3109031 RepID=UPI0030057035
MPSQDERLLASAIYVISFFTAVLGPIVIWLLKRDDSEFIDYHGREYINFFLSYTVYGIICSILVIVLVGALLWVVLGIFLVVFPVVAAIKAYEGERYKIPFVFRLL